MRPIEEIDLSKNQRAALDELRRRLSQGHCVDEILLYGSVARGEADAESDLDLLILTSRPLSREDRHQITDIVFEINLAQGTNLSTLVVDRECWECGLMAVLPFKAEVVKDGAKL